MPVFTPLRLKYSHLLMAGALLLISYSCNKDKSATPSSYHVTCTVDGVNLNFSARCLAAIQYGSGEKGLNIGGFNNLSDTASGIGFIITNDPGLDSITTGVYMDTSTIFTVLASYTPNGSASTASNYTAGTSDYQEAVNSGFTPPAHFKVVITSLTSEAVRGTFSGDFYLNIVTDHTNKKRVTNGDFYVKIQ